LPPWLNGIQYNRSPAVIFNLFSLLAALWKQQTALQGPQSAIAAFVELWK